MRFLLKITLWAAVVVGAGLALQAGLEQRQLAAEYQRLQRKVGDMPITDPTKMHLVAIETDDPLYFVWRVYLPADALVWKTMCNRHLHATVLFDSDTEEYDCLLCIRIRQNANGEYEMFHANPKSSNVGTFLPSEFAEKLTNAREQITITQLGREGVVIMESDAIAELLTVEIDNAFYESIRRELPVPERMTKPRLFSRLGSPIAFEQQDQASRGNDVE